MSARSCTYKACRRDHAVEEEIHFVLPALDERAIDLERFEDVVNKVANEQYSLEELRKNERVFISELSIFALARPAPSAVDELLLNV